MERESFEDEEVAALLNQHFVAIKVDREERPDVDHVYMTVCQAITGQGGWPLTIVMTPDQKPFFAGTYFPKTRKFGRSGLLDILGQIADKWSRDRHRLESSSDAILKELSPAFARTSAGDAPDAPVNPQVLDQAVEAFREGFDEKWGGFGSAPKFPFPHNLMFLLRYGALRGDDHAVDMARKTLVSMYRGGLYDHVGYGFARYATDRRWVVPHFEKMLYDNALLVMAYLEAYQVTGDALFAEIARDALTYVLRDLKSPEGAFYSAEDADSEGVEGKFYVWTPQEVNAVLGETDGSLYCACYDIRPGGNFEGESIPNLTRSNLDEIAAERAMTGAELRRHLRGLSELLEQHRRARIRPHRDDKVLTAWNALLMVALVKAGRVLEDQHYLDVASTTARFIESHLVGDNGRLLARYRDGEAAIPAYADDYAYVIWAMIELYEASFEEHYLEQAVLWQNQMLDLFGDTQEGGLFFYGQDAEVLIARPKEFYDGAMPSANSVTALNLLRLSRMTADERYLAEAERMVRTYAPLLEAHPTGYSYFLVALLFYLGPTQEIVIASTSAEASDVPFTPVLRKWFLPHAVLLFHPAGERGDRIERIAPFVKDQGPHDGQSAVYVCSNFACQAPVTTEEDVIRMLSASNDATRQGDNV